VTLLLGGARGGKSTLAERIAAADGGSVLFVATAQAFDDEMQDRITRHRAARPAGWHTLEVTLRAGDAIRQAASSTRTDTILLDCITLLATSALLALPEDASQDAANEAILAEIDLLTQAIDALPARWVIVSNEVGMGIVPPTHLGRVFRDALGLANQRLARRADDVLLVVAGLPWALKGRVPELP
jgi:adenosylcobinamide kinase / adenosylcobinamide-phosphate guanylyltransferase